MIFEQECYPSFSFQLPFAMLPGYCIRMVATLAVRWLSLNKELSNKGSQILQNCNLLDFSVLFRQMFVSCDLAIKANPSCIIGMKGSYVVVHWWYESQVYSGIRWQSSGIFWKPLSSKGLKANEYPNILRSTETV